MKIDAFCIATELDVEAIMRLVNLAYHPEPEVAGWAHESNLIAGDRTNQRRIADAISRNDAMIVLGCMEMKMVACAHVQKDGCGSRIGMLAVNPESQGNSIGKQILAYAESYAGTMFGSEKFMMVVVSSRHDLIEFYQRRGYQKIEAEMDYPLSAGTGIPKRADLKIQVLEKLTGLVDVDRC